MPAIRGCYLRHPQTNEEGFWLEPTGSPPGTLVGRARSAWPVIAGGETRESYRTKINAAIALLPGLGPVTVNITFASIAPLLIEEAEVR